MAPSPMRPSKADCCAVCARVCHMPMDTTRGCCCVTRAVTRAVTRTAESSQRRERLATPSTTPTACTTATPGDEVLRRRSRGFCQGSWQAFLLWPTTCSVIVSGCAIKAAGCALFSGSVLRMWALAGWLFAPTCAFLIESSYSTPITVRRCSGTSAAVVGATSAGAGVCSSRRTYTLASASNSGLGACNAAAAIAIAIAMAAISVRTASACVFGTTSLLSAASPSPSPGPSLVSRCSHRCFRRCRRCRCGLGSRVAMVDTCTACLSLLSTHGCRRYHVLGSRTGLVGTVPCATSTSTATTPLSAPTFAHDGTRRKTYRALVLESCISLSHQRVLLHETVCLPEAVKTQSFLASSTAPAPFSGPRGVAQADVSRRPWPPCRGRACRVGAPWFGEHRLAFRGSCSCPHMHQRPAARSSASSSLRWRRP